MEIIIAAVIGCAVGLSLILKFESWINKDDEFLEVEKWHNFRSVMEKK